MPLFNSRLFVLFLSGLLISACGGGPSYHGQRAGDILSAQSAMQVNQIDPSDVILGDVNAPLTIFIYSSYTCSHCANAQRDVVPALQRDFVNAGKLNIGFRDYPLDATAAQVSQVAQCILDSDAYYGFVRDAFAAQRQWAFSPDFLDQIATLATPYGLSAAQVKSCAGNANILNFITARQRVAGSYLRIYGTPTLFLGAERLPSYQEYGAIAAQIRAAL